MRRSPSDSSCWCTPGCSTQLPPPQAGVKALTAMLVGPLSVVFALFAQSTWNFHRFSAFEPKFSR